jgi:3-oxoacyl-[acyl-carrier-protein] synthase-3
MPQIFNLNKPYVSKNWEEVYLKQGKFAKISGVGVYLPEKIESNEELAEKQNLDFNRKKWLFEKIGDLYGLKLRRLAQPNEAPSDMATNAAKEALNNAGIKPEDLDLILLTTDTPDYVTPPTSPIVQYKLGAKNAGCFDINAACADQVIGMIIASHFIIMDPTIDHVLVVAPYAMTRWIDRENDQILTPLFGDGAGAVIISRSIERGYIASKIISDGSYWDCYGVYVGAANPITLEMVKEGKHHLRFHESGHKYPADINEANWPNLIKETVSKTGYKLDDLSMVLLTQVNLQSIKKVMEELKLPLSKTHWIMDKYGYTGSSCVFIALYDALKQGKIKKGDLITFCTSGVGYTMACALFRWV